MNNDHPHLRTPPTRSHNVTNPTSDNTHPLRSTHQPTIRPEETDNRR